VEFEAIGQVSLHLGGKADAAMKRIRRGSVTMLSDVSAKADDSIRLKVA
jgi:hypothetical protein